jgi:hypothetical protein
VMHKISPPVTDGRPHMQNEILSGWKEVADFLGKGVRTVQRYEGELGLPVRRPAGKSKGSVIAAKAELRDWVLACAKQMESSPQVRLAQKTNTVGASFLRIDSEAALTFASLALSAPGADKRVKMIQAARKAYDSITHLRKHIYLTDLEDARLQANLKRLKNELKILGENF